jgi:hypothetical protein
MDFKNEDRYQHLSSIVKQTAELGILLLAQPSRWSFDWDLNHALRALRHETSHLSKQSIQLKHVYKRRGHRSRSVLSLVDKESLVVFPALRKMSDEQGQRCRPITLLKAVVVDKLRD